MRRFKLTVMIVMLLIISVIVMQNLEPVKTNLIVGALEMPLAALLVCTLLSGYILGLLTTALWKVRSWRTEALAARRQATSLQSNSLSKSGYASSEATARPISKQPLS